MHGGVTEGLWHRVSHYIKGEERAGP